MSQTPEEKARIAAVWEGKLRGANALINLYDMRNQENWAAYIGERDWSEFELNAWLGLNRKKLVLKPTQEVQILSDNLVEIGAAADRLAQQNAQTTAQLAATQQQLAAKNQREADQADSRRRLDAQNVRNNGRATPEDLAEQTKRGEDLRKAASNAVQNGAARIRFRSELSDAETLVVNKGGRVAWGATDDARKAAKQALREKYPQFANEVGQ